MNDWIEAGTFTAIQVAIGSTLLLALTIACVRLLGGRSASRRHRIGTAGCMAVLTLIVGILVLPRVSDVWPPMTKPVVWPSSTAIAKVSNEEAPITGLTTGLSHDLRNPSPAGSKTRLPGSAGGVKPNTHFEKSGPASWKGIRTLAFMIYGCVAILLVYRLIMDHVKAKRLADATVAADDQDRIRLIAQQLDPDGHHPILISARIATPLVVGVFRPVIIFPTSARTWPDAQIRSALLHETAHIERHDLANHQICRSVSIMLWPQPLIHLVMRMLERDREIACDDRVLGKHVRPTEYAKHLLAIASSCDHAFRPHRSVLAMARTSELTQRIECLFREKRRQIDSAPRRWVTAIGFLFLSLFLATLTPSGPAKRAVAMAPQSEPQSDRGTSKNTNVGSGDAGTDSVVEFQEHKASGRVVDEAGNPIPEVEIFVPNSDGNYLEGHVRHVTDQEGRFSLPLRRKTGSHNSYQVWFYKKGYSVRTAAFYALLRDQNEVADVKIPLPEEDAFEFKVSTPNGEICNEATISPWYIHIPNGRFMADEPTGLLTRPPLPIESRLSRQVDGQGRVILHGVPRELAISVIIDSKDYGSQIAHLRDTQPGVATDVRLRPVGAIRGRVETPNPELLAGAKLVVETDERDNTRSGRSIAEVELDENAAFHVPAIAALAKVQLRFTSFPDESRIPMLGEDYRERDAVRAGETVEFTIPTKPLVKVSGRVLVAEGGPPVVGARLSIRNAESLLRIPSTLTDEQGYYSVLVPAGTIKQQMTSFGFDRKENMEHWKRYHYPRLKDFVIGENETEVTRPDIYLEPKQELSGKVIDATGTPVPNVKVGVKSDMSRFPRGIGETDADGEFSIWVPKFQEWERRRWDRGEFVWLLIEKEAEGTNPRQTKRLDVIQQSMSSMILRIP